MNEEGRPPGGQPQRSQHTASKYRGGGGRRIPWLEDLHARVTRILEAFEIGDYEFVHVALDDLAHDLWKLVEAEERAAA